MTRRETPADASDLARAVAVLRRGGLVAFPTETVYGLGADARSPAAVARIFAAKGRPPDHPLIVHLGTASQLAQWARDIPPAAHRLAEAFWPGPMTLVLPRAHDVPVAVTGGLDTVGLRVPDHPLALALLEAFGDGIAAPSANRYGRVSPTVAAHVREELGATVDLLLDGGACTLGLESTIVDVTTAGVRILRPGAVTAQAIQHVLAQPVVTGAPQDVRAPGRKPSHYAPRARVVLASRMTAVAEVTRWQDGGRRVGLLASAPPPALPAGAVWLDFGGTVHAQARVLYQRLRDADHVGIDVLVVVMPAANGLGDAVRDRLVRAAGLGDGIADGAGDARRDASGRPGDGPPD